MTDFRNMSLLLSVMVSISCFVGMAEAQPFDLDSDEYPIGIYSVENARHMQKLQGSGITYIHTYSLSGKNDEESIARYIAYLDLAHEHGFKVMYNLHGRVWVPMDDGIEQMLKIVNAVKDHPALGFWYLFDEPCGKHTPEELMPYYWALKKAAPDIPVAVVNHWSETWNLYSDTLDIQMVDFYPVRTDPFPETNLKLMINFTSQALELPKPVIGIHQSFRWSDLARPGETEYMGSPLAAFRFPNQVELRHMAYSDIAMGVRGTWWWSFYHAVHKPGYDWLDSEFIPVMQEFRRFVDLVAPAHKPDILTRARLDADVLLAIFERPTGTYIVLCNNWPLARSAGRWMEGRIQSADLTAWGSTRPVDVAIRNGRMTELIAEPWEVLVWKAENVVTH